MAERGRARGALGLVLLALAAAALPAQAAVKRPPQGARFAIQYQGEPAAETLAAEVVDLDLFDAPASAIAQVRRRGGYLVCYLSAGSREDWRPDADRYPAAIVGKPYEGWPGETWLDIRRLDLLGPILVARIERAVARGCDAIDPDNLDGYQADTGFALKRADAVALVRFLVREAHARGLAVGLKNVPELVPQLGGAVDFAVTESCAADRFCAAYAPLLDRGKAVFHIHYVGGKAFAEVCRDADPRETHLLKKRALGAWARTCP